MIEGFLARLGGPNENHEFPTVVGICTTKEEAYEIARHEAALVANDLDFGSCYFAVTQHFKDGSMSFVGIWDIDADGFVQEA